MSDRNQAAELVREARLKIFPEEMRKFRESWPEFDEAIRRAAKKACKEHVQRGACGYFPETKRFLTELIERHIRQELGL